MKVLDWSLVLEEAVSMRERTKQNSGRRGHGLLTKAIIHFEASTHTTPPWSSDLVKGQLQ